MDSHAALLVGATGGIGRGLADALVDEGFALTITGRDEPALANLTEALTARGASVSSEVFELSQPGRAADVVASHLRRWGRLDVLIVSSGISRRELLADADPGGTRRVIATNLSAVVDVVSAALVPLRARGQHDGGGLVVLVSSLAARRPPAGFGVYSATKAAINALVCSINEEEGSHGVRATALSPGFVDTPLTAPLRETLSQPMLTTSDIADAVRFLVRLSPAVCVPQLELARVGVTGGQP